MDQTNSLTKEPDTNPETLSDLQKWRDSLMGRKSKYNDTLVRKVVKYLKEGNTIADTCTLADISHQTFYTYCKQHLEFLEKVNEAQTAFKSYHIKNIHKWSERDWKASQFLLASKYPSEYANKSLIASSIKGDITIRVDNTGYSPTPKAPIAPISHSDDVK